jgi:hypothetical protein
MRGRNLSTASIIAILEDLEHPIHLIDFETKNHKVSTRLDFPRVGNGIRMHSIDERHLFIIILSKNNNNLKISEDSNGARMDILTNIDKLILICQYTYSFPDRRKTAWTITDVISTDHRKLGSVHRRNHVSE